jgi:RNA polymerase sigma-70 factor (ECF subfamily)
MNSSDREQRKLERIQAIEAIVARYEGPLLRYAARILQNSDEAQDAVQEAFLSLIRSWNGELKPSPKLESWLYKVTHNYAISLLRKSSRMERFRPQEEETMGGITQPDRGEEFRISDAAREAMRALQKLSPREQQLIILKFFEGKSYNEIAEICGLSIGNVGYILHNALRKLAKQLGGKIDEE